MTKQGIQEAKFDFWTKANFKTFSLRKIFFHQKVFKTCFHLKWYFNYVNNQRHKGTETIKLNI